MDQKHFKEVLTNNGVKNTKHRDAILEVMEKSERPLTAEDIFLIIKGNGGTTCLSTVYRTMEMFENKGLVIKSNSVDDGKSRYERNTLEHKHHVVCVACHKIIVIDECPFAEFESTLRQKINFEITGHKFEIYGRCNECQLLGGK
ncbi:MAG: transcriptional repressor [Vallitaleaceae bacterium]|nr:transcriptional repressor [Vallitaleaceae bacterium]